MQSAVVYINADEICNTIFKPIDLSPSVRTDLSAGCFGKIIIVIVARYIINKYI